MYEKSGLVKERSNGKYSLGYQYFWVAHNAMLSLFEDLEKAEQVSSIRRDGRKGESVASGDGKVTMGLKRSCRLKESQTIQTST